METDDRASRKGAMKDDTQGKSARWLQGQLASCGALSQPCIRAGRPTTDPRRRGCRPREGSRHPQHRSRRTLCKRAPPSPPTQHTLRHTRHSTEAIHRRRMGPCHHTCTHRTCPRQRATRMPSNRRPTFPFATTERIRVAVGFSSHKMCCSLSASSPSKSAPVGNCARSSRRGCG